MDFTQTFIDVDQMDQKKKQQKSAQQKKQSSFVPFNKQRDDCEDQSETMEVVVDDSTEFSNKQFPPHPFMQQTKMEEERKPSGNEINFSNLPPMMFPKQPTNHQQMPQQQRNQIPMMKQQSKHNKKNWHI